MRPYICLFKHFFFKIQFIDSTKFWFNEEILEMNAGTDARESDVFDMSVFNEISKLCVRKRHQRRR